jgi:peptidoglycan hydrolase CwlO-like protein
MADNPNLKLGISIAQWAMSALALPALIWAWTLNMTVVEQRGIILNLENDIVEMKKDFQEEIKEVKKENDEADDQIDDTNVSIAAINIKLDTMKEKLNEIGTAIRDL